MSRDEIREALYDLVEAGYIAGRRGLGRLCAERIATGTA
jgi:DNA-binding GntR family transcriptional regulator